MNTSCQLLATSRSFSSVRKAPRKFKVLEQGFLPDFRAAGIEPGTPDNPPAPRKIPAPAPVPRDASTRAASAPLFLHALATVRTLFASHLLGQRTPPQRQRPARQSELSLATVRVKRNDLADADLEVLASRAPAVGQAGEARARLWRRWTEWWSDSQRPALTGPSHR